MKWTNFGGGSLNGLEPYFDRYRAQMNGNSCHGISVNVQMPEPHLNGLADVLSRYFLIEDQTDLV